MHKRNCAGFALAASYWQVPEGDEGDQAEGAAVTSQEDANAARAALAVRCANLRLLSPREHRAR